MSAETVAMAAVHNHAIGTDEPMINTGRDGAAVVLTSLLAQHIDVDGMICNMDLQLHPIFLNLARVAYVTLHLPVNRAPTVHIFFKI